jgi:hypothetical protein
MDEARKKEKNKGNEKEKTHFSPAAFFSDISPMTI